MYMTTTQHTRVLIIQIIIMLVAVLLLCVSMNASRADALDPGTVVKVEGPVNFGIGGGVSSIPVHHDGQWYLSVAVFEPEVFALYAFDVKTGVANRVSSVKYFGLEKDSLPYGWSDLVSDGNIVWSVAGSTACNKGEGLYRIDVITGKAAKVSNTGCFGHSERIQPVGLTWDGSTLWMSDYYGQLYTLNISDGTASKKVQLNLDHIFGFSSVGGITWFQDRLLVIIRTRETENIGLFTEYLYEVSTDTGAVTPIGVIKDTEGENLTFGYLGTDGVDIYMSNSEYDSDGYTKNRMYKFLQPLIGGTGTVAIQSPSPPVETSSLGEDSSVTTEDSAPPEPTPEEEPPTEPADPPPVRTTTPNSTLQSLLDLAASSPTPGSTLKNTFFSDMPRDVANALDANAQHIKRLLNKDTGLLALLENPAAIDHLVQRLRDDAGLYPYTWRVTEPDAINLNDSDLARQVFNAMKPLLDAGIHDEFILFPDILLALKIPVVQNYILHTFSQQKLDVISRAAGNLKKISPYLRIGSRIQGILRTARSDGTLQTLVSEETGFRSLVRRPGAVEELVRLLRTNGYITVTQAQPPSTTTLEPEEATPTTFTTDEGVGDSTSATQSSEPEEEAPTASTVDEDNGEQQSESALYGFPAPFNLQVTEDTFSWAKTHGADFYGVVVYGSGGCTDYTPILYVPPTTTEPSWQLPASPQLPFALRVYAVNEYQEAGQTWLQRSPYSNQCLEVTVDGTATQEQGYPTFGGIEYWLTRSGGSYNYNLNVVDDEYYTSRGLRVTGTTYRNDTIDLLNTQYTQSGDPKARWGIFIEVVDSQGRPVSSKQLLTRGTFEEHFGSSNKGTLVLKPINVKTQISNYHRESDVTVQASPLLAPINPRFEHGTLFWKGRSDADGYAVVVYDESGCVNEDHTIEHVSQPLSATTESWRPPIDVRPPFSLRVFSIDEYVDRTGIRRQHFNTAGTGCFKVAADGAVEKMGGAEYQGLSGNLNISLRRSGLYLPTGFPAPFNLQVTEDTFSWAKTHGADFYGVVVYGSGGCTDYTPILYVPPTTTEPSWQLPASPQLPFALRVYAVNEYQEAGQTWLQRSPYSNQCLEVTVDGTATQEQGYPTFGGIEYWLTRSGGSYNYNLNVVDDEYYTSRGLRVTGTTYRNDTIDLLNTQYTQSGDPKARWGIFIEVVDSQGRPVSSKQLLTRGTFEEHFGSSNKGTLVLKPINVKTQISQYRSEGSDIGDTTDDTTATDEDVGDSARAPLDSDDLVIISLTEYALSPSPDAFEDYDYTFKISADKPLLWGGGELMTVSIYSDDSCDNLVQVLHENASSDNISLLAFNHPNDALFFRVNGNNTAELYSRLVAGEITREEYESGTEVAYWHSECFRMPALGETITTDFDTLFTIENNTITISLTEYALSPSPDAFEDYDYTFKISADKPLLWGGGELMTVSIYSDDSCDNLVQVLHENASSDNISLLAFNHPNDALFFRVNGNNTAELYSRLVAGEITREEYESGTEVAYWHSECFRMPALGETITTDFDTLFTIENNTITISLTEYALSPSPDAFEDYDYTFKISADKPLLWGGGELMTVSIYSDDSCDNLVQVLHENASSDNISLLAFNHPNDALFFRVNGNNTAELYSRLVAGEITREEYESGTEVAYWHSECFRMPALGETITTDFDTLFVVDTTAEDRTALEYICGFPGINLLCGGGTVKEAFVILTTTENDQTLTQSYRDKYKYKLTVGADGPLPEDVSSSFGWEPEDRLHITLYSDEECKTFLRTLGGPTYSTYRYDSFTEGERLHLYFLFSSWQGDSAEGFYQLNFFKNKEGRRFGVSECSAIPSVGEVASLDVTALKLEKVPEIDGTVAMVYWEEPQSSSDGEISLVIESGTRLPDSVINLWELSVPSFGKDKNVNVRIGEGLYSDSSCETDVLQVASSRFKHHPVFVFPAANPNPNKFRIVRGFNPSISLGAQPVYFKVDFNEHGDSNTLVASDCLRAPLRTEKYLLNLETLFVRGVATTSVMVDVGEEDVLTTVLTPNKVSTRVVEDDPNDRPYKYTFIWEEELVGDRGRKIVLYETDSCGGAISKSIPGQSTNRTLGTSGIRESYRVHLVPMDASSEDILSTDCLTFERGILQAFFDSAGDVVDNTIDTVVGGLCNLGVPLGTSCPSESDDSSSDNPETQEEVPSDVACVDDAPLCIFLNRHLAVFRRADVHAHFPNVLQNFRYLGSLSREDVTRLSEGDISLFDRMPPGVNFVLDESIVILFTTDEGSRFREIFRDPDFYTIITDGALTGKFVNLVQRVEGVFPVTGGEGIQPLIVDS